MQFKIDVFSEVVYFSQWKIDPAKRNTETKDPVVKKPEIKKIIKNEQSSSSLSSSSQRK